MASEIIVNTIKAPTTGANANKVIIPSGVTLDASAGTLRPSSGAVVQVVQASSTSTFSTSSTTLVEASTNLRAIITPKYANSKLLVSFNAQMNKYNGSNPWGTMTIFRDGSNIFPGVYEAGYAQTVGAASAMIHSGQIMVDANNTNATTFSLYVRAGTPYTINLESASRDVTVMEIAQ